MNGIVQTSGLHPRRWLRPASLQDLEGLQAQALSDQHAVIAPTHVFVKSALGGEELVGYASIAAVPLVLPWFDSRRCKPADSVYFINVMENLVAGLARPGGPGLMCVPVMHNSPFEPYIEKLGYVNAGRGTIALKKVS